MTTIANFNELCDFSIPLQQLIAEKAEEMFKNSTIESTLRLGKHEVCLKRPDAQTKTIGVYLMHGTMEMNEEIVTRYNKRSKVGS